MSFSRSVLALAVVAGGALVLTVWWVSSSRVPPESAPPPPASPAAAASPAVATEEVASTGPAATAIPSRAAPPAAPIPTPETARETDLRVIDEATVTYAAASLPKIAPYLTHADPAVRQAAREGMLQMGLSEAAPLLREAAGKLKDPREAVLLLDEADFLELPSIPTNAPRKHVVGKPPADAERRADALRRPPPAPAKAAP